MWGLGQHTLLGIVVGLWASGNTLYWVLLWFMCLGQYFTGYCCWFMHLGKHTLLGDVVVYMPRAILYWVLLLVYVGPRATHFYWVLLLVMLRLGQHTLLAIVVGL
jgi:hypothetical protein